MKTALSIPIVHSGGIHFVGVLGTGMSALAQFCALLGGEVSGSDRMHESPDTAGMRGRLLKMGCAVLPQDGSGIRDETATVVLSTAIEEDNPDLAAARRVGAEVLHRSECLARLMEGYRAIAVAGTSGKSTVTAMIFEFLVHCGLSPSLIAGAPLIRLEEQGLIGNAFAGGSDLLVVEADESDGSLVRYHPAVSVILNVSKDHKPVPTLVDLFRTLASNSERTWTNADDPLLAPVPADATFGCAAGAAGATCGADRVQLHGSGVALERNGLVYRLPLPGLHNAENLLAALAVCEEAGCDPEDLVGAVAGFRGVARRFDIHRTAGGVTVVDDFAHNPAKIAAAVAAARGLADRIHVVYQPHGFAPTRFLKEEYIAAFREILRGGDTLQLLPIYYAGGTAVKDVSSADITGALAGGPFGATAPESRADALAALRAAARPGDLILLMGARDPSLPFFAREIAGAFSG